MRARLETMTLLLGIAAVALAALLWQALNQPIDRRPVADTDATRGPAVDAALAARPARPAALASYGETLSRPLFEPARRPLAPKTAEPPAVVVAKSARPAATPVQPPPSLIGLKLLGVVKASGEPLRALIRAGDGEAGQWVIEGAQLGRWRVERINEGAVVLEAQGTRIELAMFAAPRPLAKR